MITKWKIIDPLFNNMTTFRFWCDDEPNDLDLADYLIKKYVEQWGYQTKGLIKIVYNEGNTFFEMITTLPFDNYTENNDFFEFKAVNSNKIRGIKNKKKEYDKK